MPTPPSIWARLPLKFWTAAFVAAWGSSCGAGASAWIAAVSMIAPLLGM